MSDIGPIVRKATDQIGIANMMKLIGADIGVVSAEDMRRAREAVVRALHHVYAMDRRYPFAHAIERELETVLDLLPGHSR